MSKRIPWCGGGKTSTCLVTRSEVFCGGKGDTYEGKTEFFQFIISKQAPASQYML